MELIKEFIFTIPQTLYGLAIIGGILFVAYWLLRILYVFLKSLFE
jgi:hypothetical protein